MGIWQTGVDEEDRLDRVGTKRVLRRAVHDLGDQRRGVVGASLLITAFTVSQLAGPTLVRYGIDRGLIGRDAGSLRVAIIGYCVVVVASFLTGRAQIVAVSRLGEQYLKRLRTRVFAHLLRLSLAFYDREKTGVLVARMTSDIDSMGELVQFGLLQFFSAGLLLALSFLLLLSLSPLLLALCLIAVPFVVMSSIRFQRQSNRAYLTVRERVGANLSRMQEGFRGVRVIQAFDRTEDQIERFAHSNGELFEAHLDSVRVSAWYFPVIEFAGAATTALVVGVGGWLVHEGRVSLGTVAAFVLLLSNLFEPVQQLSQLFNAIQAAGASLQKLYGLLDTRPDIADVAGAVDLTAAGPIVIENVGFAYLDGAPVLSGVSLTIAEGERIAFVGPTGAGKSTLAKLVSRFYDPTRGHISIGGVDLRNATLASLRSMIIVVPQEGFLFEGNLRDNVRIGRPEATDAEVDAVLARLGLLERFEAFASEQSGSRLSAGERQLVSLARAALADPPLLILDEATSNLDPGTEALVEAALDKLLVGRTVIVIAHRLTTAARCDRVAVIDHGRLVEVGTHDQLVGAGGRYASMFASWVGGKRTE